jgi:hypothetical protein
LFEVAVVQTAQDFRVEPRILDRSIDPSEHVIRG